MILMNLEGKLAGTVGTVRSTWALKVNDGTCVLGLLRDGWRVFLFPFGALGVSELPHFPSLLSLHPAHSGLEAMPQSSEWWDYRCLCHQVRFYVVPVVKPKALCRRGKHSTTQLQPQPICFEMHCLYNAQPCLEFLGSSNVTACFLSCWHYKGMSPCLATSSLK